MNDYLHGAYGRVQVESNPAAAKSRNAFVYIGTAPVHMVEGGAKNVNRPILVSNIAESRRKLGYSDNFADFTLCEAMDSHFNQAGIGPLVFINVLDPNKHVSAEEGNKSLTPENGRITMAAAENVIVDTVTVKSGETAKVKGQDYNISYNSEKKALIISEAKPGSLGATELTITYKEVDPSAVTAEDVIGATDGNGLNTGVFAVQSVFQMTGFIPTYLLAPGFSSVPAVHSALIQNSVKINGHWDAWVIPDMAIIDGEEAITLDSAENWKRLNGYNRENETVCFPLIRGTDKKNHHISVLRAASLQVLLAGADGIPYQTASNTDCAIAENLYLGEDSDGRVYDDTLINEKLCKNGIASAAFVGGKWVHWGAHSADYDQENADNVNEAETNRMMLYYISNDFQYRRSRDVDKPMTMNDLQSIVAEEQARLDALVNRGALTYGVAKPYMNQDAGSDILYGDYSIAFDVSTTPLVKSLTAIVSWTDKGLSTYFASFEQGV